MQYKKLWIALAIGVFVPGYFALGLFTGKSFNEPQRVASGKKGEKLSEPQFVAGD